MKRRGKWLIFELDTNSVIIHFRMEGRFYLLDLDAPKDKHDYLILYFDDFSLHYNDSRLFGKIEVLKKEDTLDFFVQKRLGLEYDDKNLTPSYLKEKFKTHHTDIKKMLLDQSCIAGIGNIYADEILFASKINPKSYADKISKVKLQKIIDNTKVVFERSLKYNGTLPDIYGKMGTFEEHLMVHKREGEKCYLCGDIVKKQKIAGRGTYYCPTCQK